MGYLKRDLFAGSFIMKSNQFPYLILHSERWICFVIERVRTQWYMHAGLRGGHTKMTIRTRKWKESIRLTWSFVPHIHARPGKRTRQTWAEVFNFIENSNVLILIVRSHCAPQRDTVHARTHKSSRGSRFTYVTFISIAFIVASICFIVGKKSIGMIVVEYSVPAQRQHQHDTRDGFSKHKNNKKRGRRMRTQKGKHDMNVQFRHIFSLTCPGYRVQGKFFSARSFCCSLLFFFSFLQNALWCATLHTSHTARPPVRCAFFPFVCLFN